MLFWFSVTKQSFEMVLASPNDQKYPLYPLVLKLNVTLARPLHLVNLYFFKRKILSDDRRLYLHDRKRNSKSHVNGLTHTKQLLNLLCIVYISFYSQAFLDKMVVDLLWSGQVCPYIIKLTLSA